MRKIIAGSREVVYLTPPDLVLLDNALLDYYWKHGESLKTEDRIRRVRWKLGLAKYNGKIPREKREVRVCGACSVNIEHEEHSFFETKTYEDWFASELIFRSGRDFKAMMVRII